MKVSQSNWLKKLGATANQPRPQTPKPAMSIMELPHPIAQPAQRAPSPFSNPMQQMTGRVGGNQTTAQGTQGLSATLGGWFGNKQGQQPTNPVEALMSWLSPNLPPHIAKTLQSQLAPLHNLWTEGLPQNITGALGKQSKKNPALFELWTQGRR